MNQWEEIVQKANQYFDRGNTARAIEYYSYARIRAEKIFYQWYNPADTAAALTVSYHNLAQVYIQHNELKAALVITQTIHNIILGALARQKICSVRKNALINASYRTSAELLILEKRANLHVNISVSGAASFTPCLTSIGRNAP